MSLTPQSFDPTIQLKEGGHSVFLSLFPRVQSIVARSYELRQNVMMEWAHGSGCSLIGRQEREGGRVLEPDITFKGMAPLLTSSHLLSFYLLPQTVSPSKD